MMQAGAESIASADAHTKMGQDFHKILVVFNPVAGLTDADTARKTIETFCEAQGWEWTLHETKKDEDLRGVIRSAVQQQVELVMVSGGDGTISDVVSGLVNSGVPLGILPSGTGNALARDLNIPLALQAALELLGGEYAVQNMDAMQIEDDYFVMNVSVGISALTMLETSRASKRRFGMFAYLWRGAQSLARGRQHQFNVTVDDRKVRFSASEVMVANEKFMGLQPQMGGVEIVPDDGRLDLFIVRASSARDYLNVALRFLTQNHNGEDRTLRYLPIQKTIRLESTVPIPVQADGEVISNTPVEIRVVPKALKVIVPPLAKPNDPSRG